MDAKCRGGVKGARLYTVVCDLRGFAQDARKKCDFFGPFFGFPIPHHIRTLLFTYGHMIKSPTPFLAVFGFYDSKSAFLLH